MPNEPHILEATGNIRRVIKNIEQLIGPSATSALNSEIQNNIDQLVNLGKKFIHFAKRLPSQQWRNKVSRAYYGIYNISRAIRLEDSGAYSTDSTDHKKVGDLPKDFASKERFQNLLQMVREDRNLCDYDHTTKISNLAMHPNDTIELAEDFLREAELWIKQKRNQP